MTDWYYDVYSMVIECVRMCRGNMDSIAIAVCSMTGMNRTYILGTTNGVEGMRLREITN